jgi:hypothetical protein
VQVGLDGSLEGFDETGERDTDGAFAVLVHLLSLLVTFIGQSPTLVPKHLDGRLSQHGKVQRRLL